VLDTNRLGETGIMAKKSARPRARKKVRARARPRVVKRTRAGSARMELSAPAAKGVPCEEVEKWVLAWFIKRTKNKKLELKTKLIDPDIMRVMSNDGAFTVLALAFQGEFGPAVSETKLKLQWAIKDNTLGGLADNFFCKLVQLVPA
jgi:hypothetical protein